MKYAEEWLTTTRKPKARELRAVIAEAYQLAGSCVMGDDTLTEGQRARLGTLLLDVLSEPERFDPEEIHDLRKQAMLP